LPGVSRTTVSAINALYARASRFDLNSELHCAWAVSPELRVGESALAMHASGHRFMLVNRRDVVLDAAADFNWRALSGPARLAAWVAHHAALVDALSSVLGESLDPVEFAPVEAGSLSIGLSIRDLAGNERGSAVLVLPEAWHPPAATLKAPVPGPLRNTPVRFRVVLSSFGLPLDQWQTLGRGDVLNVGTARQLNEGAFLDLHAGKIGLRVQITATGLAFQNFIDPQSLQRRSEPQMQADMDSALPDLEALAVFIDLSLGELEVPLAQLNALAPGNILPLDRKLADSPVLLRANGRAFARGDLLLIDDFLGVRITEFIERGTDKP
jgi:type III secretion system YscQ/HrcQ family protein